jgi:hypothetical protein
MAAARHKEVDILRRVYIYTIQALGRQAVGRLGRRPEIPVGRKTIPVGRQTIPVGGRRLL